MLFEAQPLLRTKSWPCVLTLVVVYYLQAGLVAAFKLKELKEGKTAMFEAKKTS